MNNVISDYVKNVQNLCESLGVDSLNAACELMLESYKAGKKILLQVTVAVRVLLTIFAVILVKTP